jgi:hypothetical protein
MEQLATLFPDLVRLTEMGTIKPPEMREILRTVFNLKMIEKEETENHRIKLTRLKAKRR